MKPIKFRQRVKDTWHYWGFINEYGYLIFKGIEGNISSIEEALKNSQQFTGLLDKNDKEIFEGDWFKSESRANPFTIIWNDGSFRGKYPESEGEGFHFDYYEAKYGEVIGNRFEGIKE